MDISLNSINNLNLQYLTNPSAIKRYEKMKENQLYYTEEDLRFYRKRILHLTKDLLKGKVSESSLVRDSYENYVKMCINNFKFLDKRDIIQEEYKNMEDKKTECKDINMEETNRKILRGTSLPGPKTIDKFIKIKRTKEKRKGELPQRKEIDIKNPELKNKGLVNRKI